MTRALALCLLALGCAATSEVRSAGGGVAAGPAADASAPAATASCDVAGVDAFRRARGLGFRFVAESVSGEGECLVGDEFPWFIGRAGTVALVCRFRGFDGQALRPPLRVAGVVLSGSQIALQAPSTVGAEHVAGAAPLQFTLQVAAGEERKAVLKSIRLGGTNCRHWRDAF